MRHDSSLSSSVTGLVPCAAERAARNSITIARLCSRRTRHRDDVAICSFAAALASRYDNAAHLLVSSKIRDMTCGHLAIEHWIVAAIHTPSRRVRSFENLIARFSGMGGELLMQLLGDVDRGITCIGIESWCGIVCSCQSRNDPIVD